MSRRRSSLFYFLHRALKLSAGAAYHRKAAAELLLRFPEVIEPLRAAKRRGLVKRPRAQQPQPVEAEREAPRHVPAAVSREVFLRDEGRCQWPTADGGICGSTHRVQLDHVVPVGRGGRSTADNLRILCATHNGLAAREVYGGAWMDQFTRRGGRQASPTARSP